MAVSEAKKRANLKYDSKTYKKVMLRFKLDDLERLHDHIKERDESFNGFVNRAVSEQVKRDAEDTEILAKAKETQHNEQ